MAVSLAARGAVNNPLERALGALTAFLDRERIPYMLIGAMAGIVWGLHRATFDVDVTIWAPDGREELVRRLARAFRSRAPDPESFVRDTSVLPLKVEGMAADVVFGELPYEKGAIARARLMTVGSLKVRVCSPEDLIVHKIISERSKDREDVRELLALRSGSLDRAYLDPLIRRLSSDLARPDLWDLYIESLRSK